jgi:hypothetical protein
MPFRTSADKQAVFDSLIDLRSRQSHHDIPHSAKWSFTGQAEFAKMGSWFSWHRGASQQIPEFHATKMLFESHLSADVEDPDIECDFEDLANVSKSASPQEELRKLRAVGGGLSLAYKIMTSVLLHIVKVMYIVSLATWEWYVWHIENLKSPKQQLGFLLKYDWRKDHTVLMTIKKSFRDKKNSDYMEVPTGTSQPASISRVACFVGLHGSPLGVASYGHQCWPHIGPKMGPRWAHDGPMMATRICAHVWSRVLSHWV